MRCDAMLCMNTFTHTLFCSNYTHLTHVYLFEWMNKNQTDGEGKKARITCTSTIITVATAVAKMQQK